MSDGMASYTRAYTRAYICVSVVPSLFRKRTEYDIGARLLGCNAVWTCRYIYIYIYISAFRRLLSCSSSGLKDEMGREYSNWKSEVCPEF
jgi:hypothetical protein